MNNPNLINPSAHLQMAGQLSQYVQIAAMPEDQRPPNWNRLEGAIREPGEMHMDQSVGMLAGRLALAQKWLPADAVLVKAVQPGETPEAAAKRLIESSQLGDAAFRESLMSGGVEGLAGQHGSADSARARHAGRATERDRRLAVGQRVRGSAERALRLGVVRGLWHRPAAGRDVHPADHGRDRETLPVQWNLRSGTNDPLRAVRPDGGIRKRDAVDAGAGLRRGARRRRHGSSDQLRVDERHHGRKQRQPGH